MRVRLLVVAALLAASALAAAPSPASASTRLVTGLAGGFGSTIGPDGALYFTEPHAGRVSRIDPATGAVTTFASGLPAALFAVGGPMDVVFIGDTAYVLVALVSADLGGSDVDGIYRIDGPSAARATRCSPSGRASSRSATRRGHPRSRPRATCSA